MFKKNIKKKEKQTQKTEGKTQTHKKKPISFTWNVGFYDNPVL